MSRQRHSIVDIPISEGAVGASLPFLFLENGELSYLALAWARHKMLDEGAGTSSLAKAVAAVGRFYDYYMVERNGEALQPEELRLLLSKFFEARQYGLQSLRWTPVKQATAGGDVRAITEFTDWCTENFGHAVVNPRERVLVANLNLREQKLFHARRANRKSWDFLFHLSPRTEEGRGFASRREVSPGKGKTQRYTGVQKHFPPEKVWSVISSTTSIRDKLFLLLLFFGGLRISEPLHLFASDVSILPDGTARVVLGHPEDGAFEWSSHGSQRRNGNRATFLAQRYGLGPRNLLAEKHPLHSGWKGMMYDTPKRSESVVSWLREDASRLFARLHAEYIRTVRSLNVDTHPYYFVNERNGTTHGEPMKMSNAAKAFGRAAHRIGLATNQEGVNPHGARHFYGYYCASILRLPVETTQKLMHHTSPLSTEIYYALSNEAVRRELRKAQARLEAESPQLLAAPFVALPAAKALTNG